MAATMEPVAEAAGLSQRALYYVFRKELRATPAEVLLRQRMQLAKGLLLETGQTIGEVAAACGLLPLRTINRCFWRVERMSPRAWRRSQLGRREQNRPFRAAAVSAKEEREWPQETRKARRAPA